MIKQVIYVIKRWKLSSDGSYQVIKVGEVRKAKEVKRSDGPVRIIMDNDYDNADERGI